MDCLNAFFKATCSRATKNGEYENAAGIAKEEA